MRSIAMVSRGLFDREAIRLLDPADAQAIAFVPPFLTGLLGEAVFGMLAPVPDRVKAVPVRNGDADTLGVAGALDAEKAGHRRGQFGHAVGGAVVTFGIGGGAARRE